MHVLYATCVMLVMHCMQRLRSVPCISSIYMYLGVLYSTNCSRFYIRRDVAATLAPRRRDGRPQPVVFWKMGSQHFAGSYQTPKLRQRPVP